MLKIELKKAKELIERIDPELYNGLVDRDYIFYNSYDMADVHAVKTIKNKHGAKLFYVACRLFIYDFGRFPAVIDERVSIVAEGDFYLNANQRISVQVHNNKDLDYVEKFLTKFFYDYECEYIDD